MKTEDSALSKNAFIAEIKASVPDWEYRLSEIRKEYGRTKKKNPRLKINWENIIVLQKPAQLDFSIWKKFVGLMNSKKQKKQVIYSATGKNRLEQELFDLGGGNAELGAEYLEKYLYD